MFFLFQNRFIKCNSNQCLGFSNETDQKNSKYNDYIKKRITFFMQYCCSKKLKRAIFMSKLIKCMYMCLYICVLLFFLTVNSFNIFKYFLKKISDAYVYIIFYDHIKMTVINKKDFYCTALLIKEDACETKPTYFNKTIY